MSAAAPTKVRRSPGSRTDRLYTEADVVRTLEAGAITLPELYDRCREQVDVSRDGGLEEIGGRHGTDTRWKRRVRCALQTAKRSGRARRLERETWVIEGGRQVPRRMTLVIHGDTIAEYELRLSAAVDLLRDLDEPVDLVLADPPYSLQRGSKKMENKLYRNAAQRTAHVVPGYIDVAADMYTDFTHQWVSAAADALRPGGTLAVVTGPQRAAHVQIAAEEAGLSWVSNIAAYRTFAVYSKHQPAVSHWVVTVMTRGRRDSKRRTFNCPPDLPLSASGNEYPLDWWPENGRSDRSGLLRYDNSLPMRLVHRIVYAFSAENDLVVDPFLGSGTSLIVSQILGRRFTGGDLNPNALRFAAARMLRERSFSERLCLA